MANKKGKGADKAAFNNCFKNGKPYPGYNPQKGVGKEYKP